MTHSMFSRMTPGSAAVGTDMDTSKASPSRAAQMSKPTVAWQVPTAEFQAYPSKESKETNLMKLGLEVPNKNKLLLGGMPSSLTFDVPSLVGLTSQIANVEKTVNRIKQTSDPEFSDRFERLLSNFMALQNEIQKARYDSSDHGSVHSNHLTSLDAGFRVEIGRLLQDIDALQMERPEFLRWDAMTGSTVAGSGEGGPEVFIGHSTGLSGLEGDPIGDLLNWLASALSDLADALGRGAGDFIDGVLDAIENGLIPKLLTQGPDFSGSSGPGGPDPNLPPAWPSNPWATPSSQQAGEVLSVLGLGVVLSGVALA